MSVKLNRLFVVSAGFIFIITGIAKVIASTGVAGILRDYDPIFDIRFGHMFKIVGLFEVFVAMYCFLGKNIELQFATISFISTNFAFYRIGLFLLGWHRPCSCLGNLTDALHIPPQTADTAMKIVLGYLLLGSYALLFWLWKESRKTRIAAAH